MDKTIELVGHIDDQHRLSAQVPLDVRPGPVKLALRVPADTATENDPADAQWMKAIASQWSEELADTRQDIYSLGDGDPVNESR